MNPSDSSAIALDKPQSSPEKNTAPVVDLSDATSVREAFGPARAVGQTDKFENGQISFTNPYDAGDSATVASSAYTNHMDAAKPVTDLGLSQNPTSTIGVIEQDISQVLQILNQDLQLLMTDISMLAGNPSAAVAPTEGTAPVSGAPVESTPATTTNEVASNPTINEVASNPAPAVTSTPAEAAVDTPAAAKPTSSDPFIANLQMSDPLLAKTLTDASHTMSASGYAKMESQLDDAYTGSQNDYNSGKNAESGNANYNPNLMASALKNDGLSAADQTALTSVLKTDMPSALASDKFVASIEQSDPTLAKVLTAASQQMSAAGYGALESTTQLYYTGNPNGAQGLPNQTFLDSELINSARGGESTADQTALNNILKADLPSAVASDVLVSSLQQQDPTLAKTLSDASGKLSTQGYAQLENYVEENSTWQTGNDQSLMNQALSQGGLSTADDSALKSVLSADMPGALTSTPSAAVAQEMVQAKENYQNDYALRNLNHPSAIQGNPGKSGSGYTESDQVPTGAAQTGLWAVVSPVNPNSYDKNAQVNVEDSQVYLHLKTGGWVEEQNGTDDNWWEGHYANNFQSNTQGNGQKQADGSYEFTAPPDNLVDHFGAGNVPFNSDLYDGVYESISAKTNVANSGLAMNVGADYLMKSLAPGQTRPQAGSSNWVPLTQNYQTMYFTTLSADEIKADPPPGY